MSHVLDRPVWSALTSRHAALAIGNGCARRYPGTIVPFAASCDDDPASLAALSVCVGAQHQIFLLQATDIKLPPDLVVIERAVGVQMILQSPLPPLLDARIEQLGESDLDDMLALAEMTKPGPFTRGVLELGDFFGLRRAGQLIAMAGERMKCQDYTEVSGVCVHPDGRGQNLGATLSVHVAKRIVARGETPYLHAYANNEMAIALYRRIGFEIRLDMQAAVITRADT